MKKAFVLLKTELGTGDYSLKEIRKLKIPGVTEIHSITGRHDIIVEVIGDDMDEIKEIVEQIRKVSHLTSTETFMCQEKIPEGPEKPRKEALAYVLITTRPADELKVVETVRKVEGVLEALPTWGNWDIFSQITADDMEAFKGIVKEIVQKAGKGKIQNTLTLIVVEQKDKKKKTS